MVVFVMPQCSLIVVCTKILALKMEAASSVDTLVFPTKV